MSVSVSYRNRKELQKFFFFFAIHFDHFCCEFERSILKAHIARRHSKKEAKVNVHQGTATIDHDVSIMTEKIQRKKKESKSVSSNEEEEEGGFQRKTFLKEKTKR